MVVAVEHKPIRSRADLRKGSSSRALLPVRMPCPHLRLWGASREALVATAGCAAEAGSERTRAEVP
eukprot:1794903-Pyramimonas_sp.AAC.1